MALAGVAGPLRVGGWWFRPIRCAWGSFLVLVVALAGGAGPLGGGGWCFSPIRGAWGSFLVWSWPWPAWRGRCGWVVGGSGPFGAHGVPSLSGRGPGRRGGAVAGGWLVVQAHSVRMGFLPCLVVALAGVAGPLRGGGWWFRALRRGWGALFCALR